MQKAEIVVRLASFVRGMKQSSCRVLELLDKTILQRHKEKLASAIRCRINHVQFNPPLTHNVRFERGRVHAEVGTV